MVRLGGGRRESGDCNGGLPQVSRASVEASMMSSSPQWETISSVPQPTGTINVSREFGQTSSFDGEEWLSRDHVSGHRVIGVSVVLSPILGTKPLDGEAT
jgi:hypothetical protein